MNTSDVAKASVKELATLDHVLIQNTLRDWLIALGIVTIIMLIATVISRIAIRHISVKVRERGGRFLEALVKMIQATRLWLILIIAIEIGSNYLELPHKIDLLLSRVAAITVFLQAGLWLSAMLDSWITRSRMQALETDAAAATSLTAFSFVGRLLLWVVMALLALDNIGVNVTALVASLGVGGIAVALAVQNILGDLFASLSIVIVKPFVIGEAIAVDGLSGTVEPVGLKTPRGRSGEELVFSNSDLLKARLHNYKRMRSRNVVFTFGVVYQTPPDKLERIPGMVADIIKAQPEVRFDRAHFKEFGQFAYNFEVLFCVLDSSYSLFMDTRQTILLALVRAFAEHGIGLAYPTQTVFVSEPAGRSKGQEALPTGAAAISDAR